ncbi:MAG: ABC transporter substrate-binding protein [Chloroflexi bacterium]|nr:ABC transporter substrate-binding protein [Chloroflexota bacterium]
MRSLRQAVLVSVLAIVLGAVACAPAAAPSPTAAPAKPPVAATAISPAKGAEKQPEKPAAKPAARPPLSPTVKVRYGTVLAPGDAPVFVALDKGYFKEEGIDLDMITFDSAARMIPALSAGQMDVGGGGITVSMFNAFARGVDIRVVGQRGKNSDGHESDSFAIRPDLVDRVKDFKDLKGLKVALPARGNPSHSELGKALAKGGLSSKDVDIVEMAWPAMITALANKAIDVATFTEPYSTQAVALGVAVIWKRVHPDISPNHQSGIVMYAPQFGQSQPEAAKRFMVAFIRGVRAVSDAMDKNIGKDEILKILIERTTLKDPVLWQTIRLSGFDRNSYVGTQQMIDDQNYYVEEGLIKPNEKADIGKLVDNSYVEYALGILGKQ